MSGSAPRAVGARLAVQGAPDYRQDDERAGYIMRLTLTLDGIQFWPGELMDPDFHSLHDALGNRDTDAEFPAWAAADWHRQN